MINERKQFILETIVKEYVKTAQPVSSAMLVERYKLDVSPATVRNDMVELEEEGYIYQPHTSAGRVPTEAAYAIYLENLRDKKSKVLKEAEIRQLADSFAKDEASFKQTARLIAELAGGAVFWAFHKNDLYYTGLSNLFAQPEFARTDMVCDVSAVIDRLEEIINDNFESLPLGRQTLVGSQNPFGHFLSAILVKYKHDNRHGLFGILGPMRMDYGRNLALADFINEKFS